MNSPRKILCFDPQHGRLVTWLQTKNAGNTEATLNVRFLEFNIIVSHDK